MNAYFIPGLAADSRVFKHIRLPAGYEPVYLNWLEPQTGEHLKDYALRMASAIRPGEEFILVGLSLGGMLATEISKVYRPRKTIIIASIPSSRHLPGYYRWAGRIGLQKILPVSLIKSSLILKRLFTTESTEDKIMIRDMVRKSDTAFIRWALHAVLEWENHDMPGDTIHIHGTHDRILPFRYTRPTHHISRAGHLMILNRADDINRILEQELSVIR